MNITYYLKGAKPIKKLYVRLYYNRLDILVSTNVMLTSEQWDFSTQSVLNEPELNIGLQNLKLSILRSFNRDYTLGVVIDRKWVEKVIKTSFMRPTMEESLVSPLHTLYLSDFCSWWMAFHSVKWKTSAREFMGSVLKSQYTKFGETLQDYEKIVGEKLSIRSLSVDDINGFVEYLESENYQVSTIKRNISRLKFFMLRASEHNIEVSNAFKQRVYFEKEEELDGIYLNEAEIAKINNLDLSHDTELDNVRDNLIISCWTGCRVGDLMTNLKTENIKDGIISIKTQKTGTYVQIPVHPQVKSVLRKRFGMLPQKMNTAEYNVKLKIVCQLAEIDNLVYGKLFNSATKRKEFGYYKKYLLCSSHVGRKSMATNLSGKINDDVIMACLGWSSDSMKQHYDKRSKGDFAKELSNFWGKSNN
jgi:integrase